MMTFVQTLLKSHELGYSSKTEKVLQGVEISMLLSGAYFLGFGNVHGGGFPRR